MSSPQERRAARHPSRRTHHAGPAVLAALAAAALSAAPRLDAQTIYEQMLVRSPTPTPNHLTKLRVGSGKFLVLGEKATVLSSDDGETWAAHATGYTRSISDIAFGNGTYVISASDSGTVLTSFDLENWEIRRPADVPFNPWGITFHDGRFYICGSGGEVSSSPDGVDWTSVDTGAGVHLREIAVVDGLFIAVGNDNTVVTSPDGTAWTLRPTGVPLEGLAEDLLSVTWLNDLFVVGGKDGTVLTSPDTITWTHRVYEEGNDWFYGGIYEGGAYYLTGRQGRLRKTVDFSAWDEVQTAETGDNDIYGVAERGGTVVAIGRSGTINTSGGDLTTWTSRKGGFTESFNGLVFAGGQFVSTDYDGTVWTSPDGVDWTGRFTMPDESGLQGLAFGDGKFAAVSSSSEIIQSVDGVLWSAPDRQFEGFPSIQGIEFANGRWFLLGRDGLIRSSTNLSDWTTSDVTPAEEISDLVYADGLYVAVGTNGAIFTSVDGTTFQPQASGVTSRLNAVAHGAGRFVAAGSGVTVLTSLNGVDWSADGVAAPPAHIGLLVHREGQFVGFGSGGRVGLSPDGLAWTTVDLAASTNIQAFAEGNDRLVAVGNSGVVLSTDPLPDHTLTVTWTGDGTVTTEPPGSTFKQGTVVTLTAAAGADHTFFGWGGDASGTDNPLVVTIDGDKAITAQFQLTLTGYQLWRVSNFNAAERDDDAVSGPGADPDGDGRPNALEYFGGTGPKSPDQGALLTVSTARLGADTYAVATYTRAKDLPDLTERVAVSHDLEGWRHNGDGAGPDVTTLFNLADGPGDLETVSVRALTPLAPGTPVCVRLEIPFP